MLDKQDIFLESQALLFYAGKREDMFSACGRAISRRKTGMGPGTVLQLSRLPLPREMDSNAFLLCG